MESGFCVNGEALRLDILQADTADAVAEAMAKVQASMAALQAQNAGGGAAIRAACGAVYTCFDDLFGAGTAGRLFGGRHSFAEAGQAFFALADHVDAQRAALLREMHSRTARYSPARALGQAEAGDEPAD